MMPVHVNYFGTERPKEGTYYLVAQEGLLMHVRNNWLDAVIPVTKFQALAPAIPGAKLKLPPIDALVFAKTVAFFRKIYKLHQSEAAVLLHYSKTLGWEVTIPVQQVTEVTVHKYEMTERLEGYDCVGTMHSHGYMSAYHSSVDVKDEAAFDGIHITIGSLQHFPQFSMAAEVVFRGERFPLDETNIHGVQPLYKKRRERERPQEINFSFDPSVLSGFEVPEAWVRKVTFFSNYTGHTYWEKRAQLVNGVSRPSRRRRHAQKSGMLNQIAETGKGLQEFFLGEDKKESKEQK